MNDCGERPNWRREWDSNPRYGFPHTRFPSVRLKPLGHPSAAEDGGRTTEDKEEDQKSSCDGCSTDVLVRFLSSALRRPSPSFVLICPAAGPSTTFPDRRRSRSSSR